MSADNFFSRWSGKTAIPDRDLPVANAGEKLAVTAPEPAPAAAESLPTHEDLDQLTPQADFSAFMAQGVDEGLKRAAMKKLFSDPHYNIMDGLDIYIGDYNTYEALTPAILASLNHVKDLLDPLSKLETSVSALLTSSSEMPASDSATPLVDEHAKLGEENVFAPVDDKKRYAEETDPDEGTRNPEEASKDPERE